MSLIDIDTTGYTIKLPTILMSQQQHTVIEPKSSKNSNPSPHQHTGPLSLFDLDATSSNQDTNNPVENRFPVLGGYNLQTAATALSSLTAPGGAGSVPNYGYNPSYDANKAFDNVVFDILKVDPDDIAGQLTLIDLPLFKQIQPDELISCKWMSREKLIKAPNIVQFTRRFNQTTFWCQKEILNCRRIETRGKMITNFIKMAKRLNELHSFNSLMAIIVALKAQPIHRLKKTWSQYVSKRDVVQFERLADIMFDTNDNKRKMRDMHMNCKLPCIPFLGLFLTDLIHIDIAHPHNGFDNPQRRNQMNNICRLISEYQQSNYQDLTSISCDCCFTVVDAEIENSTDDLNRDGQMRDYASIETKKCLVPNCSCLIHHGHVSGAGIINSDGTIYINEIGYIRNYLNSFLYIEELQKFKEDENYRDSLELEPEVQTVTSNANKNADCTKGDTIADLKKQILHVSPSSPCKLNNNNSMNGYHDMKNSKNKNCQLCMDSNNNNHGGSHSQHRKSQSIASNMFNFNNQHTDINKDHHHHHDTTKLKHPLDESIETLSHQSASNLHALTSQSMNYTTTDFYNELPLTQLQQKQLLASVKINDPSSLLRELLKHRHNSNAKPAATATQHHSSSLSFKNKFNCYSSSSADVDDDSGDEQNSDFDEDPMNNSLSIDADVPLEVADTVNSTPIKLFNMSMEGQSTYTVSSKKAKAKKKLLNSTLKSDRSGAANGDANFNGYETEANRLNGRNLINSLNEDTDTVDSVSVHRSTNSACTPAAISKTSSSSDLFHTTHTSHNSDATSNMTPKHSDLSGLTNLSHIFALEQKIGLMLFESPVKRKCIMKNFRKPRFSQWKSYWLQLIAGNLLIYYPIKSIVFNNPGSNSNKTRQNSETSSYIDELISTRVTPENTQDNPDIHQLHQEIQQQQKKERMQSQLQQRKVCYNKNPCKMHPIANWMVVNLFQEKEDEMIQLAQKLSTTINMDAGQSSSLANLGSYTKFDIQLNDLNNGNMYKYRFDSLQVAKEWLEQFKLASTYHEREKPDNLIRFD